ncbi:hypothetical protein LOTGIDRAFT_230639 [Lottia gigantea]|uniref:Uncharacterized protein n=1 Tax=Lottia gigantea TaxID=225164 RepID=V4B5J2_LOTGI|nr:hypothetical protein LOTGIDRAFT_230639 [Lottia gigantea]ESP01277.1 hypothetical protein LOTGIDRAFT_230639 [Lottia gigantea]
MARSPTALITYKIALGCIKIHQSWVNFKVGSNSPLDRPGSCCLLHTNNSSTCETVDLRRSVSLLECNINHLQYVILMDQVESRNTESVLVDQVNMLALRVEKSNQRLLQVQSRQKNKDAAYSKIKNKDGNFRNGFKRLKQYFKRKSKADEDPYG